MIKGYAGSYASEQSQCLIQFCFDETTTKHHGAAKSFLAFEDAKYLSCVSMVIGSGTS
ncbi:MAG: hypothetical protein ACLTAQ_11450 [Longicatena caecimuris]|uniref:hypothetical protein n=1 Tax=Longicatena caecimuris TaxID=1796635 RepID=UPI0039922484